MSEQTIFKVGTRVVWTSSNRKKEGVITHIVPAGKTPADIGVPRLDNSGLPRDHETYVIRAQQNFRGKPEGRRASYWPRVSLLTAVDDRPAPDTERLTRALSTIATFPVTDPANQDAVNMQKIAMEAINAERV